MDIKLQEITVRELTEGYEDRGDEGVAGYGGRLDIRPPYQREFIYKEEQRNKVIDTVRKDYPLNVMYWATRDDGTFEVMDGQQRTISICQYVTGDFSFEGLYFHNLQDDEKDQILDYKLMVYVCEGTDSEKLKWFETINIAGEKLTDQELLNAVYHGSWVADAKRYFSKNGCVAYGLGSKYLNGSPIRQDYLETAIKWINHGDVVEYMSMHQHDANAMALWRYFQDVITWVKGTFTTHRKEMKGVDWGSLYNKHKYEVIDAAALEDEIARLMADDDVTKKSGIYPYVLNNDERNLSVRAFSDTMKREAYELQAGICAHCGEHFELSEMEADHVTPWSQGGKTTADNCQMLCRECNRRKSDK